MSKRLIVFDLDGTLAASKLPITVEMATLLRQLLDKFEVAIIGGGKFEQFMIQVIQPLNATYKQLVRLHILPTNGTCYYRYKPSSQNWVEIYNQALTPEDKLHIIEVLEQAAKELGYWEPKPWGEIIEDRGTQVTFSGLGQKAPLEAKAVWDPDGSKKQLLRDALAAKLPDFTVHSAGLTSVDVTAAGLDKAKALDKLLNSLQLGKTDMLYFGDALEKGGNDAVVKDAGYQTVVVNNPADTMVKVQELL